jgi:pilus assembly protein CpaC
VNFLPIVLGNGKIHLEVRPEISALNAAAGITIPSAVGTTSVPGFDLRSAQVAVQMEPGQTLAIGGLIQNSVNAQNQKVPILGDIPGLAFCFSSKTYTETEEELIILITPHLVEGMACCQIPKYLPGRETRRADDFELFLEGILEAPRGPRDLHPYHAAYLNGPTAGTFPCGDAYRSHHGRNGCAPGAACAPSAGCAPGSNCAPAAGRGPVSNAARQNVQQVSGGNRPTFRPLVQTMVETPDPVVTPEPSPMLPNFATPRASD